MRFILYFDQLYRHWAPVLLGSIRLYEPNAKVTCFCYNMDKSQIAEVVDAGADIVYQSHIEPLNGEEVRFHIISRKASMILQVLQETDDGLYVMMDVDMLLLRPLTVLKEVMWHFDMGAVTAHREKFCGGFYAFRCTTMSIAFLTQWEMFLTTGKLYWDKDQPSMASIANKLIREEDFRVLSLPRTFLDHKSLAHSFVWSAHKSELGSKAERFNIYSSMLEKMKSDARAAV